MWLINDYSGYIAKRIRIIYSIALRKNKKIVIKKLIFSKRKFITQAINFLTRKW